MADKNIGRLPGGLPHIRSLLFRLHSRVPKAHDVNGFIVDAIDQFIQAIDNDAAVCLWAVGEEWVNLPDAWTMLQLLCT